MKISKNLFKKIGFLMVLGLVSFLLLGNSVFAASGNEKKKKQKRPKNTGIISVKTKPNAFPVKIDGQPVGVSGITEGAEFYLTPGVHLVEVELPQGKVYRKEINVVKNVKNCICLNILETEVKRPCPYDMVVNGPDSLEEGNLATFFAENKANVPPGSNPLNYVWTVSPSAAPITSGIGTDSITVNTENLGGQTLNVSVDVGDGVFDESCRQRVSINTPITPKPSPTPTPTPPEPFSCDFFSSVSPDDDKARFDNCVIQVQTNPLSRLYIIVYPGTDRLSTTKNTYERVRTRAFNYFVKDRKIDSTRVEIVRGSSRTTTSYELWIVPPGANLPPIN